MSVQALGWVFDHSPTKGTDRLVLLSLANYASKSPHDGAWESWPGVATIQREAGLDRKRTVMDALARLVAGGHVEREINGAPDTRIRLDRRPNLYRILLGNGETCGDARCVWCGETPERERGDATTSDGETRDDTTGRRRASPEPLVEPSAEPEVQPQPALALVTSDDFDFFWTLYPRKDGKASALKAWPRACRKHTPTAICNAAQQYADDPNRDPAYTKHAATWLNGECWNDPPLPVRAGTTHRNGNAPRLSKSFQNVDAVFDRLEAQQGERNPHGLGSG